MKFKMRKRTQRKFNKIVKKINNSIAEDELWRGRFVMIQNSSSWLSFEDKSGGYLEIDYSFIDKKTGRRKRAMYHTYSGEAERLISSFLFYAMNDFIIKDCNWSTWGDSKMKEDKTDYTKLPIPKEKSYEHIKFI